MVDFKIDTSFALYIFAVIFFLISLVYFGAEIVFELSPVTKSSLLFSTTSLVVAAGILFKSGIKSIIAYISGFLSYTIFLGYTIGKFNVGTEGVLGALMFSAIAFALLGWSINNDKLKMTTKNFKIFTGVIILATVLLTAVDMTGAQPEYELQFQEQADIVEGTNKIGEITVTNSFFMTREYELADYRACTLAPERETHYLDVADYRTDSGNIHGGQSKKFDVNFSSRLISVDRDTQEREPAFTGVYNIEQVSSCPPKGENRTIYIYEHQSRNSFID